jgi:hypothetical protein
MSTWLSLVLNWLLIWFWDDFYTLDHGYTAILMFTCGRNRLQREAALVEEEGTERHVLGQL